MNDHAKLLVLPLIQLLLYLRIGWPFVLGGRGVDALLLGVYCEYYECEKKRKNNLHFNILTWVLNLFKLNALNDF